MNAFAHSFMSACSLASRSVAYVISTVASSLMIGSSSGLVLGSPPMSTQPTVPNKRAALINMPIPTAIFFFMTFTPFPAYCAADEFFTNWILPFLSAVVITTRSPCTT